MGGNDSQRFQPNWLVWDVDRSNRSFRVYVVEPRTVDPPRHASMFRAAIQAFLPAQPCGLCGRPHARTTANGRAGDELSGVRGYAAWPNGQTPAVGSQASAAALRKQTNASAGRGRGVLHTQTKS
jgi:hypothetical protein